MVKVAIIFIGLSPLLHAAPVPLQNATATFSQSGFEISKTIAGTSLRNDGWSITPNEALKQTAVWETVGDIGTVGGTLLTFTLQQNLASGFHQLGRFRISVTTDNRSTFADGLQSGGDVTANWTVLDPITYTTFSGVTLTKLVDLSLLASGATPITDTYTVTAFTTLKGISGIRLELIPDASLPHNGSGRNPSNGNFVLSKLTLEVPDNVAGPSSRGLNALGGVMFAVMFAGWFYRSLTARV